jgi:predicted kinase
MTDQFWSLAGPSRFVNQVIQAAEENGIAAATAPDRTPPGLLEALQDELDNRGFSRVIRVKSGGVGKSVVQRVASAAGIRGAALRSIESLLVAQETSGATFLMDRIEPSEWIEWAVFLRAFKAERQRLHALLMPNLVVVLPVDLPRGDVTRIFGRSEIFWRGRVSWFDMRTFVGQIIGYHASDTLADRIAKATVVELAGYDPGLASFLARQSFDLLIDWEMLIAKLTPSIIPHPTWSNGWCDEFDGRTFHHTLAALARNDEKTVQRRIWRAHVGTIMTFVDEVRDAFCSRYRDVLDTRMPYVFIDVRGDTKKITDPRDLELYPLRNLLEDVCSTKELTFLKTINNARNRVAHFECVKADMITGLSSSWDEMRDLLTTDTWTWPRCGQSLTVMVGPTGAGKSRHVRRHHSFDQIVSSDEIRKEKYGTLDVQGSQDEIFIEAHRRVYAKLSKGESVVFDATNLRSRDRLAVVDLAPVDIKVAYVVVDRPLDEKLAQGEWRLQKADLIASHTELFNKELPAILRGDDRENVVVEDLRTTSDSMRVA